MKKTFIYLTLISIALLSCKKDNHTNVTVPQGKLYPVTFNLSSFNQQNSPIGQSNKTKVNATVPPDSSNIARLVYKLYDSANTLKKTVSVRKGTPGFGVIKDSLAAGNYTAVFIGVVSEQYFTEFPDGSRFLYGYGNLGETFYKKISFVMGNQTLQQNVDLQRINSQVQVVIKDAIPAGVSRIDEVVTGVHLTYSYFKDRSYDVNPDPSSSVPYLHVTASNIITSDKIGTTNMSIGPLMVTNTVSPVTVSITAYNSNNLIIASKTIDISLQRNTKTILTGNLFTNGNGANGFTVAYNTAYNPVGIEQGF